MAAKHATAFKKACMHSHINAWQVCLKYDTITRARLSSGEDKELQSEVATGNITQDCPLYAFNILPASI